MPAQPGYEELADAIVHTVAYVDVFDYPLTATEIHRYLIGLAVAAESVHEILSEGNIVPRRLTRRGEFFTLPGRESIVETRRRRQARAEALWCDAIRYGRGIAALPFVRMVAVTGSLAVNNVLPGADIDYLIVTETGRLWLCRAFVILLVRLAARRGVHLCPNYFLSENALVLQDRNLYTAHELVQMVPIAGVDTYRRLRRLNPWATQFLPNATHPARRVVQQPLSRTQQTRRAFGETMLRSRLGAWLETWEMGRKIEKLSRGRAAAEAAFCPDWCKGHFEGHGEKVMAAYSNRVQRISGTSL
jgi:hypothetical protein